MKKELHLQSKNTDDIWKKRGCFETIMKIDERIARIYDSDDVAELENIIRFSIRKFLNLSKNISKKELKNQGKLPDGKTVREYLLEQLDLGLINRLNLEKFSKKTTGVFD